MRAIVLADGDPPARVALDRAWPDWQRDVELVIAADGGVRLADGLGLRIDLWVGDGDSLAQEDLALLADRGVPMETSPRDKDESDTELALLAAIRAGADSIVILGALGGAREDHAIANIALLGHPAAAGRTIEILDARARIRLLSVPSAVGRPDHDLVEPVRIDLSGRIGDIVSLVPLDAVSGVTTFGLQYPLHNEPLVPGRTRSLSNIRIAARAHVSIRSGRMLILEAPATLTP